MEAIKNPYVRCLALFFGAVILFVSENAFSASASHIWLERPTTTNLPAVASWSILRGGNAPALLNESPEQVIFASYEFEVSAPGGEFQIWGRTYDPGWSSPARLQIDGKEWQQWKPGPANDREIANGVYVMEWHSWGKVSLTPGKHQLRLELTEKRPKGDIRFFVLDALLLSKGDFAPKGVKSPEELVADQREIVKIKVQKLENDRQLYIDEASAIAQRAMNSDLGALHDFLALNEQVDRALEGQKIVERNQSERLSGKITQLIVKNGTLELKTRWSQKIEGKMWIAFLQREALYASTVLPMRLESEQVFSLRLPDGLPSGTITVVCVPIDQRLAKSARENFESPAKPGQSAIKPSAWGIYRDGSMRVHPWNVTKGGMMMWDGAAYIPIGGMVNTKLTWTTKAADETVPSTDILKAQLELLKQHGLDDIYFNAFSPKANPASLAKIIATAEESGMKYGLHVSSSPDEASCSAGFVRWDRFKAFAVDSGASDTTLKYAIAEKEYIAGGRCIWAVFSPSGKILSSGIGVPTLGSRPPGGPVEEKELTQELTFLAKFDSPLPESGRMVFVPELRMSAEDPSGFMDGIATYIRHLKEVYGSLSMGPGLRMWIDPFCNELHFPNTEISTSETFQCQYAAALLLRYRNIEVLNQVWGAQGVCIPDFETAARLIPLRVEKESIFCMDPKTQRMYIVAATPGESLHDLTRFKGNIAEQMIGKVADALKEIADVPVILKHNCWFSDWLVNPLRAGGHDGAGFESYCYGDSIAYHNSLVPLTESLASARRQWIIETETAAAAFDGQKDYVGYVDRLQMLNDFDLMAMLGAKGIFTFGFAFDPPANFQVTELIRDPRQLEWMSTYAKTIRAASERLAEYIPEVYGWYPVSLRERQLVDGRLKNYEMDGNYLGTTGQIRMAPDGRWIVPAFVPKMDLKGLLVPWITLTQKQRETLVEQGTDIPVWVLGGKPENALPKTWKEFPLDTFTASGIGVIPASPKAMTLDGFRQKVLGYQVFQTSGINGQTLPDGSLMVWTCVERQEAVVRLPASAQVTNLQGKALTTQDGANGLRQITLIRTPEEKFEGNAPPYLAHLPSGYYYKESQQPETAIVKGTTVAEILRLNPPAWHRWLPREVPLGDVAAWKEAEDFSSTTFNQPRVEGYSRYSGGAAIGMNTHWGAPAERKFLTRYEVEAAQPFTQIWIRRMDRPAMDVDISIDGKPVGRIPVQAELKDILHLNPWNAGLGLNNLNVGWAQVSMPQTYAKGKHTIEIVAVPAEDKARMLDAALLGGQSDASVEREAREAITKLQGLQIDALMLSK